MGYWSNSFKKMREPKLVEPAFTESHPVNSPESNETDSTSQTEQRQPSTTPCESEQQELNSSVQQPEASTSPGDSESKSLEQLQLQKSYNTPSQNFLRSKIDLINADLVGLLKRRSGGLLSSEQEKQLTDLQAEKDELTSSFNLKKIVSSHFRNGPPYVGNMGK